MPTLLEALSEGFDDITQRPAVGDFARKLSVYTSSIVDEYMKFNIDLNKLIAKIAKRENLNDDQIQRIIEEVNNQVYLIKYNQMKNFPEREVVFDLASREAVKKEINGTASKDPTTPEHTASHDEDCGMEKKASWDDDSGDSLNAFNYSSYEFRRMAPDAERTKESINFQKIAQDIILIEESIEKCASNIAQDSYTIADAMVQYSMRGLDCQEVFDDLCKSAQCSIKDQTLIKTALDQRVNSLIEDRKLPSNYELKLEFVNTEKVANQYSLNELSFMKEASFATKSNQAVPVVVTDTGTIRDINDLVSKIHSISRNSDEIKNNVEKKNELSKISGYDLDQLQKIAASGKGLGAYIGALTGASARAAKGNLNKAKKSLSSKLSDPKLQDAKAMVDTLQRSKKNIDVHPRMGAVNKTLSDAFTKYDDIASKADEVINRNALRNPLDPRRYFSPSGIKAKVDRSIGKSELNRTQNMAKKQVNRIKSDLGGQISNAERKLSNVKKELDVDGAINSAKEAEKIYNKAIASRKSARGITAAGVGAGVALNEVNKRKKAEQSGVYY